MHQLRYMRCITCRLEINKIFTVLNEYLHIHSEDHDSLMEGSKIVHECVSDKIKNYCNLLESIGYDSESFTEMIGKIRNIDISGKTYREVRKEILAYYKGWSLELGVRS